MEEITQFDSSRRQSLEGSLGVGPPSVAAQKSGFPSNIQGKRSQSTDWTDDDIIIAVVGNTGSGRTTFINTAASVELPIGNSMKPCTTTISATKMDIPSLTSHSIILVDTPGLDVIQNTTPNVIKAVTEWLRKTYRRKVALSGILFVQQISDTNKLTFTGIRQSLDVLGIKPTFPRIRLVTTMWDDVDASTAQSNEKTIFAQWSKVVVNPDLVPCRFDITQLSCIRIILPFIRSANQRSACRLIEELAKTIENPNLMKIFSDLLNQRQVTLSHLLEELEKPDPDRARLDALVHEHEKIGEKLNHHFDAVRPLKPPFSDMLKGAVNWVISWHWVTSLLGPATASEDISEPLSRIRPVVERISPDDKAFLLLGLTGSGKSQFISDCVGFDVGTKDDLLPIYTSVNLVEGRVNGSRIFFLDTPGFDQGEEGPTDVDILKEIKLWVAALHHCRVRLMGVIFLHNITVKLTPRLFLPSKGLLSKLLEDGTSVTLVSTHWDQEVTEDARDWQKALATGLWKGMIELGAKEKALGRNQESCDADSLPYVSALSILREVASLDAHTDS